MGLNKLNRILKAQVTELAKKQPLKSDEHVVTGVKLAAGGFGPRFYINGQSPKERF